MILSVGAASDAEIAHALNLIEAKGVEDITILHCMLLYPTPLENGFLSKYVAQN